MCTSTISRLNSDPGLVCSSKGYHHTTWSCRQAKGTHNSSRDKYIKKKSKIIERITLAMGLCKQLSNLYSNLYVFGFTLVHVLLQSCSSRNH